MNLFYRVMTITTRYVLLMLTVVETAEACPNYNLMLSLNTEIFVKQLDLNDDGTIDHGEVLNNIQPIFKYVDSNKDGLVSFNEDTGFIPFQSYEAMAMENIEDQEALVACINRQLDIGSSPDRITEISSSWISSLFHSIDTNDNDVLNYDELGNYQGMRQNCFWQQLTLERYWKSISMLHIQRYFK